MGKEKTFVEKLEALIREDFLKTGEVVTSITVEPATYEYSQKVDIVGLKFTIKRETR